MRFDDLNEYQKAAVLDESPACIVRANVGSGKTTVLTEKVVYLHEQKQVPLKQMIVLTFTNKAAGEIRDRLPDSTQSMGNFGTFHSVAFWLLQNHLPVEETGRSKAFTILEPEAEQDLALRLADEHKLKIKYKNRLPKRIEQEYPLYFSGLPGKYKDDLYRVFDLLEETKKTQDQMTFRDLLRYAICLLKEHPYMAKWIIIDEVQDSSKEQMEFVAALKGAQTSIFAVGDPNQLIYSWRGSTETLFYTFKQRFAAKELTLPINYRSSTCILEAARRFQQFGSELTGSRDFGEKIQIRNHYDPFQEAGYLAVQIQELHERGIGYVEIGIFYRLQSQSQILESVFSRNGIPCQVPAKEKLSSANAMMALAGDMETAASEQIEQKKAVQLMTLHASKGLEFRYVFIIGLNDGLIPLSGSRYEEEEEERRLLFVGMTRAKEYLELSFYTEPGMVQVFGGPGRYLRYLPQQNIQWEGQKSTEERRANLQNLRKQVSAAVAERGELNPKSGVMDSKEPAAESSASTDNSIDKSDAETATRRVRHPKYGTGIVLGEDAMMIEVEFEHYGKKQFVKAFSELQDV